MGLSAHRLFICSVVCQTLGFPCSSGQTAQGIRLKLGGYIHYGTPQAWLTFVPLNSCHFLWLAKEFPLICRHIIYWIERKFGGWAHYGTPQAWYPYSHAPLNFCNFLACDCLNSFRAFKHKPLIELNSNLVDKFIMGLPSPVYLLVVSHHIWFVVLFGAFSVKPLIRLTLNLVAELIMGLSMPAWSYQDWWN